MTREQEAMIIQRVIGGETEAFELLVLEYQKNVYNVALRITGNAEDAADMAQEAFIKAYNSIASFKGDSRFSVWLYRIVTNVSVDFLRSRARRPASSLTVENEEGETVELEIADEGLSPERLMEAKLTSQAVRRGLEMLPEDYRQILLLREIQGLSYDEIAQVLDIEIGTVKSRIFRARKKLCAYLIKDGNIPDFVSSGNIEGGERP